MNVLKLCSPAIMYLAFSFVHIFINISRKKYNEGLIQFGIMLVFTALLNVLCQRGLGIVSWFIVFIPFIMMTLMSQILFMVLINLSGNNETIDDINELRSNTKSVPLPSIEFSECKSSQCEAEEASSSYLIEHDNSSIITDIESLKYDALQLDCECG
tara:strand:+ start:309 stop:779 length:471 start_codon:yes stop_codon:yes gene_type:complete